jgi:hypothetical protein
MTERKDKIRRNDRALKFFHDRNLDVRIVGQIDNPAFVYKDQIVLNCYVHNFYMRFVNAANKGDLLFQIKLSYEPAAVDQNGFMDWMNNYEHKPIYKIALEKYPALYLSGYSLVDLEDKDNTERVPVFGTVRPKVYFTRETAEIRAAEFSNDQYQLIVEE